MVWHRLLSELEKEQRRQQAEEELAERYRQVSDDELLKSRHDVEAKLEALKRDFPDYDIQSGTASNEIRHLEKEREGIIVMLARRGKLAQGVSQPDKGSIRPTQREQNASGNPREAFVRPILAKKGWSVHDWAMKSKVDFHTADHYLKGKSRPYASTLKKLADALDVEVAELPS